MILIKGTRINYFSRLAVVCELDFDASCIYLVLCWLLNVSLSITMFKVIIASLMPHKIQPLSALLLYASILVGKEEQDTYFA